MNMNANHCFNANLKVQIIRAALCLSDHIYIIYVYICRAYKYYMYVYPEYELIHVKEEEQSLKLALVQSWVRKEILP